MRIPTEKLLMKYTGITKATLLRRKGKKELDRIIRWGVVVNYSK